MIEKRSKLVEGQKIFLQKMDQLFSDSSHNELKPMIVTEANGSSAYISHVNDSNYNFVVDQKTIKVKEVWMTGYSYKIWLSKEEFYQDQDHKKERKYLIDEINSKMLKASNHQLRKMLEV